MTRTSPDEMWRNERNWGGGFAGFYFCKDDPRLWVPKKIPALGFTVNLGHPRGGATLVSILLAPVAIVMGLLLFISFSISFCG